jgi:hypothetical protein
MGSIVNSNPVRPIRTQPNSKKDEKYHLDYARWCVSNVSADQSKYFQYKSLVNWNFLFGNQWIMKEDQDTFMLDETNETRNRVRFVENTIRPMVNSLVGKVIQMDFTGRAVSSGDRAVARMESEMASIQADQQIHDMTTNPKFKQTIKDKTAIGDNMDESVDRFMRTYKDEYEQLINVLIKDISERNNIEKIKVALARQLATTGMAVAKGFPYNGGQKWDWVDPLFFLWDPNAKDHDLSDGSFMGEFMNSDPAYLIERYPKVGKKWGEKLEKISNSLKNSPDFNFSHDIFGVSSGRVPVYEMYWRDNEKQVYGWVYDEFGYELYTRLDDEDGKYSEKDAIEPSGEKEKEEMKGKLTQKVFMDVMRYCIFCPAEYAGTGDEGEPIVFDFGIAPYNETYLKDISNVEWPYKCHVWDQHNGYVQSPVDDAIHPQRFLNRMLSMAEAQANNSGGSGVFYDSDMIDPKEGEESLLTKINRSKPIGVKAKGRLNNSVMPYDSTIRQGTLSMFDVAEQTRGSIDHATGRNVAMKGQQGGKRESVGVTDAMLEVGNTMQEPFFFALSQIMLKISKSMATQGKRIYIDNKRRLQMIGGDGAHKLAILTEDMHLEDFRVYIKRVMPDDQSKDLANADMKEFVQLGLIDQEVFSKYYNTVTMDQLPDVLREAMNKKIEASMQAAKDSAKAQEDQAMGLGGEQMRQEELVAADSDVSAENQMKNQVLRGEQDKEKILAKEAAKVAGEQMKVT